MRPTARIDRLIESHGDDFVNCPGCSICDEIKSYRKLIDREPAERYKHILDKGKNMTKSDIALLLQHDIQRKKIRQALKMEPGEFQTMMVAYGFSKRRGATEMGKVNFEAFKKLKDENPKITNAEIAEKFDIKPNSLDYHIKKWKKEGLIKTTPKAVQKETYESVKQQVGEAIKGDPQLIKKLQGRIVELEDQVKGYPALMERASRLEIENMKLEENLKDESLSAYYYKRDLERAADQVEDLKDKLEGSYIESSKWEDQARLYARENDLMNGTNKDLREICEQLRRERNASVELLKVTL